jgi:hypothetical protein
MKTKNDYSHHEKQPEEADGIVNQLSLTLGFLCKIEPPNNYCVLDHHEPARPSIRPEVHEPTLCGTGLACSLHVLRPLVF